MKVSSLWKGKLPTGTFGNIDGHFRSNRGTYRYRSATHQSWFNMIVRCYQPVTSNKAVLNYVDGKVRVTRRWVEGDGERHGFLCFLEDMGERPVGMTLDRIDPTGNYTPENCRWADPETQATNKRRWRIRKQ